jgi:hypothetical protein
MHLPERGAKYSRQNSISPYKKWTFLGRKCYVIRDLKNRNLPHVVWKILTPRSMFVQNSLSYCGAGCRIQESLLNWFCAFICVYSVGAVSIVWIFISPRESLRRGKSERAVFSSSSIVLLVEFASLWGRCGFRRRRRQRRRQENAILMAQLESYVHTLYTNSCEAISNISRVAFHPPLNCAHHRKPRTILEHSQCRVAGNFNRKAEIVALEENFKEIMNSHFYSRLKKLVYKCKAILRIK